MSDNGTSVAPPAGAWIETPVFEYVSIELRVAPPAGAWIETKYHEPR
ncbi:hypothetical protein PPEP_b0902 [Pseudoalteromonas peptidolytica F12-50-A1]|uniref:Uncharacterized protein n=1 Tax=Pseudoalteromonas peptidolytica F12-50-A1 TaxID=1315280 RepID=A0A8I0N131_9GAMM|nr:hypothetical protein [Pseudoalteromonas peptidolytica F12-50-A1]